MYRNCSWAQTAILATVICVACSIPSCFLAPLNTIVKYLACVVICPHVRLTWSGLMSCVPDLRILLQTRVYMSLLGMYLVLWLLWPGRDRVYMVLKPPVWTVKKGYHGWVSLMEYTRACLSWVIYQQGWLTWSDTRWLRSASVNRQGIPRGIPAIHNLLTRSAWQSGSWRQVSNKVYHLHVRAHALIWRMTSYHVCMHVRMWLYVVEWMFRRFISNRILCRAGSHIDVLQNHKVKFFLGRQLPLRAVSRWWGRVNQVELPLWLRTPAIRLYVRLFDVNMNEALVTDLTKYRNMSEFFRRSLKPHLRPVDKAHPLTSPSDGRILHIGRVEGGRLEQVKGVTYSLSQFMGQDYKFMDALRSKKSLSTAIPEHQTSPMEFIQSESNLAFHTGISMGPANQDGSDNHPSTFANSDESKYEGKYCPEGFECDDQTTDESNFANNSINFFQCTNNSGESDDSTLHVDSGGFTMPGCGNKCFGVSDVDYTSFQQMLEGTPGIPVQSSYTKTPIRLSESRQSLSDDYQVEEHIFEQVYAINEEDLLSHQSACATNGDYFLAPSITPSITPNVQVAPSSEKNIVLQREAEFAQSLITNPDHVLHHCIVYLAPGDYHKFHSPVDWTVYCRRHFCGNLFSVNPKLAGWLQGLFTINERVMYAGRWQHGFFSMTAVGATNVGSINVAFDQTLMTNISTSDLDESSYNETYFQSRDRSGVQLSRGQLMGDFNLGSTIVLLFEAPSGFKLRYQPGDRLKYGQGMVELKQLTKCKTKRRKRRPERNK